MFRLLELAYAWLGGALVVWQPQAVLLVVAERVGLVPRERPPCHGVTRRVALLGHRPLWITAGQRLGQQGVVGWEAEVVPAELAVVVGPEPVRG